MAGEIRIYFDVKALEEVLRQEAEANDEEFVGLDILFFKVYECASKHGTFIHIADVDYDPTKDYIELDNTQYTDKTYWFALKYVGSPTTELPIVGEDTGAVGININAVLANKPVKAGSLVLKDNGVALAIIDNAHGKLQGAALTADGTINYESGAISAILAAIPALPVTADYSYFSEAAEESDLSDPVVAEDMANIIATVSAALGDTERDDEETQIFSDTEYITKIRAAMKRYKGDTGVVVQEYDIEPIIILVRISCCYDMAYDNAKYTKLGLPDGISLDKGARVKQYLDIAKALENHYKDLIGEYGDTDEDGVLTGTPSFEVVKCTRKSYFSDLRLPPRR